MLIIAVATWVLLSIGFGLFRYLRDVERVYRHEAMIGPQLIDWTALVSGIVALVAWIIWG